jgi:hypothetical protein
MPPLQAWDLKTSKVADGLAKIGRFSGAVGAVPLFLLIGASGRAMYFGFVQPMHTQQKNGKTRSTPLSFRGSRLQAGRPSAAL